MAISASERRRQQTARRITSCALRLAEAHGIDGFTLDELATDADVSRRTLFNYFPSKIDAILGVRPRKTDELVATFRSGGPSGSMLHDVAELAARLIDEQGIGDIPKEDARRSQRVMEAEPRLLLAAHQRFEDVIAEFIIEVQAREGAAFDPLKSEIAVRLIVELFDIALRNFTSEHDPHLALSDAFRTTVRAAEELAGWIPAQPPNAVTR